MLSATARLENNISMFDRIPVIHGSQPANPVGSFVGQFFWNGSGFKSFCVEGQQSISPGLHTFPTVTSLSASGLANADLVEQFWRSYGPTTPSGFTSVTDAAAFQLGIWEIISDGVARDLKSGSFRVGDSASPAVARAESWLNGTGTPAAGAGGSVALHVMQHPTMQDQVIWGPLPPPSVSVKVTPTSVTEDGSNKLTYAFTASPAPTAGITVNYRIGGSAKAGSDFTGLPPGATTGTITIPAGSTSPVTLTIVPTADTEIEPNETVILTLQQGAGYALGTSVATGTITNDDLPAVTLAVWPASVTEDGTTNLVYTFKRTGPTTSALTVRYDITGTADGADYTGATPGTGKTISFAAGSATATVTIDPTVDTTVEFDETVILTLASGSGYTVGTKTPITGTIFNDDLPGTVTGRGWFDANDDGSYSASESPLSGIIVNLFDSLGSPALDASLQPVAPTTIDAGATYQFPNLRPGSYTVSFTDTVGYLGPGTAGAVYAGIVTVQLAQTAIVDLLFSQVVITEEPPAPPAPPTADTLTWDDFKEVDKSPDPKHPDRVAYTGWNDTIGEYETGKPTIIFGPQNGPFTAKVTLALKMAPSFTAVFDKAESWVVKGKQTPQLLEHERLHLRIAEYIAKKAELNFPANMKGVGEAQGNTKDEAARNAGDAAWDNDLVPRVNAFLAEWERIEKTITDLYDSKTETDHGRNPDQQTKWERDWQQRVDAELTKQGWKVQ